MNDRMKEFYMSLAIECSKMSRAKRLQVGAIIVKNNNVISFSWNGTPAGWDNICEDEFGLDFSGNPTLVTKPEVIHAESNSIMKLASSNESGKGSVMFLTHAPCIDCAKLIYGSGITQVYYKHKYRDQSGVEFLKKCNVIVELYTNL
jgi:dCMP deaminase